MVVAAYYQNDNTAQLHKTKLLLKIVETKWSRRPAI